MWPVATVKDSAEKVPVDRGDLQRGPGANSDLRSREAGSGKTSI